MAELKTCACRKSLNVVIRSSFSQVGHPEPCCCHASLQTTPKT